MTLQSLFGMIPRDLCFYLSEEHECPYLPDHQCTNLFVDPHADMDNKLYQALIDLGFRRSGEYVYRPHCNNCNACISTRIPVARFTPNRSQRRTDKSNRDLSFRPFLAQYHERHFLLYQRYMGARHTDGSMDTHDAEQYMRFLTSSWSHTLFVEMRLQHDLLGVAVVDVLPKGLSAVYTFYEPNMPQRSLGTQAVLWQLAESQRQELDYVYLGYWVEACDKMSYKTRFKPLEIYSQGNWQEL